jgi:hypothetical protein
VTTASDWLTVDRFIDEVALRARHSAIPACWAGVAVQLRPPLQPTQLLRPRGRQVTGEMLAGLPGRLVECSADPAGDTRCPAPGRRPALTPYLSDPAHSGRTAPSALSCGLTPTAGPRRRVAGRPAAPVVVVLLALVCRIRCMVTELVCRSSAGVGRTAHDAGHLPAEGWKPASRRPRSGGRRREPDRRGEDHDP